MFFKFQRRRNVLDISDTFATLESISDDGDLEFDFTYSLSQSDAVQMEALTVSISVTTKVIRRRSILSDSHRGFTDNRSLIRNVLMQMSDAKSAIKQQRSYVAAERMGDVTSKINNEIVGQLHAGAKPAQIQKTYKSRYVKMSADKLKANNDVKPVLYNIAHDSIDNVQLVTSASYEEKPKQLMNDMIVRQGLDPTHVLSLQHRSIPYDDNVQGTLRPARSPERAYDPSVRLLNYHIFNIDKSKQVFTSDDMYDDQTVNVLVSVPTENVDVHTRVVIPHAKRVVDGSRDAGSAFVKFSLLNTRTGVIVDTVTKTLDIVRHVQLYSTPRKAPIVKVTRSEVSTRANLEIRQVDKAGAAVQIWKKSIFKSTPDTDDYKLISTHRLTNRMHSLLVQVDLPRNSSAMYRVVPLGAYGVQGAEYTNVVINPSRYSRIKTIALSTASTEAGVKIEARKIPPDTAAIQFLVRNLTKHENTFSTVGTPQLVDDSVRIADHVIVVDRNVQYDWIYEYAARLISRTGDHDDVGSSVIEFIQVKPSRLDTQITGLTVSHGDTPDVQFNITTTIVDNDIDILRTLLDQQGMLKYFDENVKDQREMLKNIVAHNVQRVDVTTGTREDFGTVTSTQFSDVALQRNAGVSPLRLGHKYRYDVSALIRAPETMFETLEVTRTDQITKKPYTFKPSKFLHPLTLKRGSIMSPQGLRTRYAKDQMQHGLSGQVQYVEVSFDGDTAVVVDARAARFDDNTVTLTWKVRGDIATVDHFLVMKEVNGIRTLIGKAHSEFEHGSCQYLHSVGRRDVGELVYVITPVFNSYDVGASVKTNSIVV